MIKIGVTVSDKRVFPPMLNSLGDDFDVVGIDTESLKSEISTCDVLYLWDLAYDALRDIIDDHSASLGKIKLIYVARQGKDEWLLKSDRLTKSGVAVQYANGAFSDAIAEYTVASLLMLAKNLHLVTAQREWKKYYNEPVSGSKVLLLGRGSIAQKTRELLESLNLEVTNIGRQDVRNIVYHAEVIGLSENLESFDHVICCLPLDESTDGLLDEIFFSRFHEVNFINVSRGEVVDHAGLELALDKSYVRAALLDVFRNEPLDPSNMLWEDVRVVVSPHQSYRTIDWDSQLHNCFMRYLKDVKIK